MSNNPTAVMSSVGVGEMALFAQAGSYWFVCSAKLLHLSR